MTTLKTVAAAAAALAKAEAATDSSNAGRTAATLNLFKVVGAHFAGDKTATVEAALPVIYTGKWDGFSKTVQKSRKTEWNTVREVATRDASMIETVGAVVVATGREFKSTMLRALTFAKNNPQANADAVKAKLEAKPVKTEANDGDIFETFMAAGADLFKRFPARFKAVQPQLAGLQSYYNGERGAGRLKTTAELRKPTKDEAAIDFAAAK